MDRFRGMAALHVRPPGGSSLTVFVAGRRVERLVGLAGLRALPPATGLLIPGCRSVHTFAMRFALDVLFVTCEGDCLHVQDLRRDVTPFRLVRASRAARTLPGLAALELAAGGMTAGFGPGQRAAWRLESQHPAHALG
jgi:uncharacterized membrane protein (UPF0127 family)